MSHRSFTITLLILLPILVSAQLETQWRGIQRRGIYPDTGLLTAWPPEGPALVRAYEGIGNGYGSPVIAGNRLYITGEVNDTAFLFSFDDSGALNWKVPFGKEWVKSYPGSRSAPTVAGDLVYVTSGMGHLSCFEAGSGKQVWSVDVLGDLHGVSPMFGFAEAPLVHGNLVFITPGGPDTNVVALDRFTGRVRWICQATGERPAYHSPVLISLPARDLLVLFTAYTFLGIDTRNGDLLWQHDQVNIPVSKREPGNGDTHSNTAWFHDGSIYYLAGDGNGAVKLSLSDDGKRIEQVWRNKNIDNYMGGFIIRDDRIYTCSNNSRSLLSLDASSGEVNGTLKIGTGSLISADGMIYYYTQGGKIHLVDPDKMESIGSFSISRGTKEHFSHPVIADGILYIRHGNILLAYDIKG